DRVCPPLQRISDHHAGNQPTPYGQGVGPVPPTPPRRPVPQLRERSASRADQRRISTGHIGPIAQAEGEIRPRQRLSGQLQHHQGRIMTDYGQDLLFGSFITPINKPATHAVDLALLAERAGLDLVTFQDHPYQPAFHDTWTLLSYVAAQTSRIRLSGNVLNLPLRPPAVMARSAARLDLLSGGRFELGLGGGAVVE